MAENTLWVVVPFFNEEKCLLQTLDSLLCQSDLDFTILLVNNNSTDGSVALLDNYIATHPHHRIMYILETQKGTGAAADTGFRYAIAQGAKYIARTDADCLAHPDWIKNIRYGFEQEKLEFIVGKIKPRTDEPGFNFRDRIILPLLVFLAENFGKIHRHGKQFKYIYIMVAGNNLAVTGELYLRAGGFPRTRIEDTHEDRVLSENIRTLTSRAKKKNDVIVYNSIRRAKKYGYWNTLMWYWDHKYKPEEVDIR